MIPSHKLNPFSFPVADIGYQTVFYKNRVELFKAIEEGRTYGRAQEFPVEHIPMAKCSGYDKVVDMSCAEGACCCSQRPRISAASAAPHRSSCCCQIAFPDCHILLPVARKCLRTSLLSRCLVGTLRHPQQSLPLPGYVRPEEASGSRAVTFLNKLLTKGLTLTGINMGMNTTGFTLCYKLLTSSLGIRSSNLSSSEANAMLSI